MSAQIPTDPAHRDALAGEYVLGMVDAQTASAVARAMASDVELRQAIEAWEDRLVPIADQVPQEAPPPELWDRIASELPVGSHRRAAAATVASPPRAMAWLWRAWAVGASVAAVALGGIALQQSDRSRQLEATLQARPSSIQAPSQVAVQPPLPAPPGTGLPQVQQATTSPDRDAPVVKPATADGAAGQPSMAPVMTVPVQPVPFQSAPSAVVQSPPTPPSQGPVVRPAIGSEAGSTVRPATSSDESGGAVRPSTGDGAGAIRR